MTKALELRASRLLSLSRNKPRIRKALRLSLRERQRTDGIHAHVVIEAVNCGLTINETVEFPDTPGNSESNPRLQRRTVICFTEDAWTELRREIR